MSRKSMREGGGMVYHEAPPSVERIRLPNWPQAKTLNFEIEWTADKFLRSGEGAVSQVLPLLVVRRMVPLSPTIQPNPLLSKVTSLRETPRTEVGRESQEMPPLEEARIS